jgi:hypothetical protein
LSGARIEMSDQYIWKFDGRILPEFSDELESIGRSI